MNYFQTIESKTAADVDLFNIGINIKTKFNKLFENEGAIYYVIIENQISPIATRMKTIQGMIVQYFIMSNLNVSHIEFISAANKLKVFEINELIDYFNQQKKKDDLADSFLQGIWFLNNKKL